MGLNTDIHNVLFGCYSSTGDALNEGTRSDIFTPKNIAKDMVDLLPLDVWNPNTTFIDIACKSGVFLIEVYNRLDEALSKLPEYSDKSKRHNHIINNQIYALCMRDEEEFFIRRAIYGDMFIDVNNIISPDFGNCTYQSLMKQEKYEFIQNKIERTFKHMQFDIILGNPPYNNDLYLDFVTLSHNLSYKYTIMITPAKWQAKGGNNNEIFRKTIVPYMSHIVFYPESQEIFDIRSLDGISYYLIGKDKKSFRYIINKCRKVKYFNNIQYREVDGQLNNASISICNKLNANSNPIASSLNFRQSVAHGKYYVMLMGMSGNCYYDNNGRTIGLNKIHITDNPYQYSKDYDIIYVSDNIDEVRSFVSYINSKLMRFIAVTSLVGQRNDNAEAWRFIPNPGLFDHIFTNEELYYRYGIDRGEVGMIEEIIKG